MAIGFEVFTVIKASPQEIYEAWLDSEGHSQTKKGGTYNTVQMQSHPQ